MESQAKVLEAAGTGRQVSSWPSCSSGCRRPADEMWPKSDELLSGILLEKPGQGLGGDWELAHDVVK